MNEVKCQEKVLEEFKGSSELQIKEEIILQEVSSDSESTLSDNEKPSYKGFNNCEICYKYNTMFIILKNHECTNEKCNFCQEISHWTDMYNCHRSSHEDVLSTDSTATDAEDVEGTCEICTKYDFMIPLLDRHKCSTSNKDKCQDCIEVTHWCKCYKEHFRTHKEVKKEVSSDSTASDSEEMQNLVPHNNSTCSICLKYESMLVILEIGHECLKKCEKCSEIINLKICYQNHKNTHFEAKEKNVEFSKISQKFDCGICLKLNSIITKLGNHSCCDKKCAICSETTYWLSCIKNHKKNEKKSVDITDKVEIHDLENLIHKNCGICVKFQCALNSLKNHGCVGVKEGKKCIFCIEITFWFENFKQHLVPLKNFLSCLNCGKRFSGEKMLNVHKSYCETEFDKQKYSNQFSNSFNKCKICKKAFSSLSDLKKHETSHSDFKFMVLKTNKDDLKGLLVR